MSQPNTDLTDFEILQLAATLSSTPQATPEQLVSRMFECAHLINTKLKTTQQESPKNHKDLEQFFKTI